MKRILTHQGEVVFVLAALLCAVGLAWAAPHFINVTATVQSDGDLEVKFKEAGLGDNLRIDYIVDATFSGTCVCATKSGTCPAAANKEAVPVSASGTFDSGKNGSVSATLVISPCPASEPPTCGSGQTLRPTDVTYTDITITDTTTPEGPESASPSSVSASGLFTCK